MYTEIGLWSSENSAKITRHRVMIGILIVITNLDALLGSNSPQESPSKEKIIIANGLYNELSGLQPMHSENDITCIDDASSFVQSNGTSITYDRPYYMYLVRKRHKLLRSENYSCPMAMNVANIYNHWNFGVHVYKTLDTTNWTCLIPRSYVCDGFSNCLIDECGCGRKTTEQTETQMPVFYCAQQPGCISFSQVTKTYYNVFYSELTTITLEICKNLSLIKQDCYS